MDFKSFIKHLKDLDDETNEEEETIDIAPMQVTKNLAELKNPSLGMKNLDFNKTNNIGIFGATGRGKGVFINNLLMKHFIHFVRP